MNESVPKILTTYTDEGSTAGHYFFVTTAIGGDQIDDWWVNIANPDIVAVDPISIDPTSLQDPGDFAMYFDVDDNR